MLQIDMVYWWTPTKDKSVDFNDVRGMILGLRTRGFNLKLVTFDRWGSHDMMQELQALGVTTEVLSVAKKHYDDFKVALQDRRVVGPSIDILLEEFKQLQVVRGDKIDHRRSGSKDLADAVVGAAFNASTRTPKGSTEIAEIRTLADRNRHQVVQPKNVIKAPPGTKMPDSLNEYLSSIRAL
jgi:phage terminase large subunit-like protein